MVSRHPSEIERVITFDLDGVLAETALYERAQNMLMLNMYSLLPKPHDNDEDIVVSGEFSLLVEERMKRAFFESGGDPVRHYQILLGRKALGPDFPQWHKKVVDQAKDLVFVDDEAVDLLDELSRDERTGIALLTSRDRSIVTPELIPRVILPSGEGPRSEGFFDITITADDVGKTADGRKRLKPDTSGLEKIAAFYSNIPYDRMTMIDDRTSGIIPAVKLGVRAIGFASGYMRARPELLHQAGADRVVTTHRQLHEVLQVGRDSN